MNQITISGNLTRDPEVRQTQSGVVVCHFAVAVKLPNCAPENPVTDFFDVNAWRGTGEACARYLKKGSKVVVQGKLTTRTYESREGQKVKAYEVEADSVEFMTVPETAPEATRASRERITPDRITEIEDNQLPF